MRSTCGGAISIAVLPLLCSIFDFHGVLNVAISDHHFIGLAFEPFDNNNIESRWNLYIGTSSQPYKIVAASQFCFFSFFLSFVLFSCWFCYSFLASFVHDWKMTCCYYFFFYSFRIDKMNESFSSLNNIKFRQRNS